MNRPSDADTVIETLLSMASILEAIHREAREQTAAIRQLDITMGNLIAAMADEGIVDETPRFDLGGQVITTLNQR